MHIFEAMRSKKTLTIQESIEIRSAFLERPVQIDCYLPPDPPGAWGLLLINDGQDLEKMGFKKLLDDLYSQKRISPLLCVGIHAGPERKMEYGVAAMPDYAGRGARAALYTRFIIEELLPDLFQRYPAAGLSQRAFAGWSLGALSAMDIVWSHPTIFSKAGLFSGSFWWRTKDQTDPGYNDKTDRIMHNLIRAGRYQPFLQFFFQCGTEDEKEDRNHNGVIDAIDDTQDLIKELIAKGYHPIKDLNYLEVPGGHHDLATWARVIPVFLEWMTA